MSDTNSKKDNFLKNLCPEWRKHRNKLQSRVMNRKIRAAIKKEIILEIKQNGKFTT